MNKCGARAATGDAEVTVVNPADDDDRLAALDKDVASLVWEGAGSLDDGDVSAVSGRSSAIAPEENCLECAVRGNVGRGNIVRAEVVGRCGEVKQRQQCADWNAEEGNAEDEKKASALWRLCLVFIHRRREESPNDPKLSDGGGWRGPCMAGGKAAAEARAVTAGAVRCSA